MCGISGHVRFGGEADVQALRRVTEAQAHRGPDNLDVHSFGQAALGHNRLSIIDLSEINHQPMVDPVSGNAIVFNGEIYNFQELRKELEAKGETFTTKGDTEVALKAYRIWGSDCVNRFRGMFAIAIWNPRSEELFLARDRLGKKPIVYAETREGFVFASEIRSLCEHPVITKEMDPEAMELYLALSYIPAPWSIYKSIRKLPPGAVGVLNRRGLSIRRYYEPEFTEDRDISLNEALDELDAELREAIRLRLISDVPLGLLLSGGVDSSLIAAIMAGISPDKVKTFSVGFDEKKYDELPHARRVADLLGTDHHEDRLTPDALETLPAVVRQYGEPYADNSALPSYLLCGMVKQHVTVALNGDGGDELSGGYSHYRRSLLHDMTHCMIGSNRVPTYMLDPWMCGNSAVTRMTRHVLSRCVHPELKAVYRPEYFQGRLLNSIMTYEARSSSANAAWKWRGAAIERARERAKSPIGRLQYLDVAHYLPGDLLVKMDIAAMAHGLEVRSPLLDQNVVALGASLPSKLKCRPGISKFLLKKLAERYLPKDLVHRKKQGFSTPVSAWLKGDMSTFLKDHLEAARPYLAATINMDRALAMADEHISGKANHGSRLWLLLTLALWAEGRG